MTTFLTILFFGIALVIGNWIALIPIWLLGGLLELLKCKNAITVRYISRAVMWVLIGTIFELWIHYWWLDSYILNWLFFAWVIFFGEPNINHPSAQFFINEWLHGNNKKYETHKTWLIVIRIIFYLIGIFWLFYYFL